MPLLEVSRVWDLSFRSESYSWITANMNTDSALKVFGRPDVHSPSGWNISPVAQQLVTSLMLLGSIISSVSTGFASHFYGRKVLLRSGCVLVVTATVIMQATSDINVLYLGRVVAGMGVGILVTSSQLYIQVSNEDGVSLSR